MARRDSWARAASEATAVGASIIRYYSNYRIMQATAESSGRQASLPPLPVRAANCLHHARVGRAARGLAEVAVEDHAHAAHQEAAARCHADPLVVELDQAIAL